MKQVLIIASVIIAGLIIGIGAFVAWKRYEKREGFDGKSKFVLYYATWCPYCTKILTSWCELRALINQDPTCSLSESNGTLSTIHEKFNVDEIVRLRELVEIKEYEVDSNRALFQKENIKSFPTIVLYKDGKKYPFTDEASRTTKGFVDFLKKHF